MTCRLLLVPALLVLLVAAPAQDDPSPVQQLTTMLTRNAAGHSPTEDEIRTVETATGLSDPELAHTLAPLLNQALTSPDATMRQYALALLIGVQILPDPAATATPAKPTELIPAPLVAAFKADVAAQLAPLVPAIAHCLADDLADNRMLAITVLGGFSAAPPAGVFPPLYAYLRRDDAISPAGLAAVSSLLQLGPAVTPTTAAAIAAYLRRPDQTTATRADLLEAIADKPIQSQSINRALLTYLDADDPALRARVILALPRLDLAPSVFADTRARIADLAAGGQDAPEPVTAAKSITACWTRPRPTIPCPTP